MSDYSRIKNILAATMAEDIRWLSHGRVAGRKPDPTFNPWMPFQMADFIAVMAECVAVSGGGSFLDVGSGIGTKIEVAKALFGLKAAGLEIDPDMFRYANASGRTTILADALSANPEHYSTADIIWVYRPFRDSFSQRLLEHTIYGYMKPGAIIAGGALENPPNGFEIIIDDWEIGCRGAWKKPLDWEPVNYDINEDV